MAELGDGLGDPQEGDIGEEGVDPGERVGEEKISFGGLDAESVFDLLLGALRAGSPSFSSFACRDWTEEEKMRGGRDCFFVSSIFFSLFGRGLRSRSKKERKEKRGSMTNEKNLKRNVIKVPKVCFIFGR